MYSLKVEKCVEEKKVVLKYRTDYLFDLNCAVTDDNMLESSVHTHFLYLVLQNFTAEFACFEEPVSSFYFFNRV